MTSIIFEIQIWWVHEYRKLWVLAGCNMAIKQAWFPDRCLPQAPSTLPPTAHPSLLSTQLLVLPCGGRHPPAAGSCRSMAAAGFIPKKALGGWRSDAGVLLEAQQSLVLSFSSISGGWERCGCSKAMLAAVGCGWVVSGLPCLGVLWGLCPAGPEGLHRLWAEVTELFLMGGDF